MSVGSRFTAMSMRASYHIALRSKKNACGVFSSGCMDGERQPCMVIDGHEDRLPARAANRVAQVARAAFAGAHDLLGIDVQQITGCLVLVAQDRLDRLQSTQVGHARSRQDAATVGSETPALHAMRVYKIHRLRGSTMSKALPDSMVQRECAGLGDASASAASQPTR